MCPGLQVSRLQVAELIASIVTSPEVAENKVEGCFCCSPCIPTRPRPCAEPQVNCSPALIHSAHGRQVLEVVAETDAPRRPYEELLAQAPSDVAQADKLAQRQAAQQRQQQLDAALERVRV